MARVRAHNKEWENVTDFGLRDSHYLFWTRVYPSARSTAPERERCSYTSNVRDNGSTLFWLLECDIQQKSFVARIGEA